MTNIIFPPRPRGAVPPTELDYYESLGIYCVQPKYNGSRSIIHIKDDKVEIYSRHGRPHLNYEMSISLINEFLELGLKKEVWLDGELLVKTKAADTKGKIVLFDILFYDKYLFLAPNQMERIEILKEICGKPTVLDNYRGMGYVVSDNILMAPTFLY